MSNDGFEGWAYKLSDVADHTWVDCPGHGHFVCWGGSSGPDNRKIVSGSGNNYKVANCYRKPAFGHNDTAGIIYAVNGVCHQTANLFMYPARTVLNYTVRGYWASVLAYSVYGTAPVIGPGAFFLGWLAAVYNPCYQQYKDAAMVDDAGGKVGGDGLFAKIQSVYEGLDEEGAAANAHDIAVRELAVLTEHAGKGVDPAAFEDLHREFLSRRDDLLASGVNGRELADRMNRLLHETQRAIAERIGSEVFASLNGTEPGEFLDVVDAEIATRAAGYES